MRAAPLLISLALSTASALAQTPAPEAPEAAAGKHNQRIEHIRVEDAGSRVDETRVGGQTQSIAVQPKVGSLPSYEVQSNDGARAARQRDNNSGDTTGTRVWNLIKF